MSSIYSSTITPASKTTPDTRCKIETIAVTGNLIVERSRLTGLFVFTAVEYLVVRVNRAAKKRREYHPLFGKLTNYPINGFMCAFSFGTQHNMLCRDTNTKLVGAYF